MAHQGSRSEEDFQKFMLEQKTSIESVLSGFEASLTPTEVSAIVAGKDNMKEVWNFLMKLCTFYGDMDDLHLSETQIHKYRLQTSDQLATHSQLLISLSKLCAEIYKLHAEDCFQSSNKQQQAVNTSQMKIVRFITSNFHNFTDSGEKLCIALSSIEFLFEDYVKPILTNWFSKHVKNSVCQLLVNSVMGFTYNMFYKNNSIIYDNLTRLQVVDPVMPYLKSSALHIQVQALVLIAFALDESKSQLYESATDVMQFLVNGLEKSLDSPDRRSNGYHTTELSVCLNRLALNEVNKKLLIDLGLLPVLQKMCTGGKEDEVTAALDILFTLSFKEENRLLIQKEFSEVLQKLFMSSEALQSTGGLWRNYGPMQGLDMNLGGQISAACPSVARPMTARNKGLQQQQQGTSGQHVMISYNHEQKQLVIRIKEALVKNNIKVWIDYERMNDGSTMGMMAEAVEDSYAFLMCMSRTYKESNNCRLEAEYAYKTQRRIVPLLLETKYKPNGWLGLILGLSMYHDFSGKYPFDSKLADLLEVLRKARLDNPQAMIEGPIAKAQAAPVTSGNRPSSGAPREHHFPSAFPALPPITSGDSRVRQWTGEQTRKWASEKGLPDSVLAAKLSGEDMHFLLVARDRAPESFYRMAERYLHPSDAKPADVARFVNALYEL